MVSRGQYWFLVTAAALAVVLAAVNVTLSTGNRRIQAEVSSRHQFVQQSIQLEGLYRDMVKRLADLSAKSNDEQLRRMLETHGVTVSRNPSAPVERPKKRTK